MTKRKWINLILFFILAVIFLTSDWRCESTYPIDKTFSAAELQEDLAEVQEIIESRHPALRYYNFENRFANTADSLRNAITSPWAVKDFFVDLNVLIEKVNCGHTSVQLPDFYWKEANEHFKHFPFKLFFTGNKAYCLFNLSKDSSIVPGSEILIINGIPVSKIVSTLLKQTSSDGFNQTYKFAQINRKNYGLFPGYSDFPEQYQIEYISTKDSSKQFVEVKARSNIEIEKALSGKIKYPDQYDFEIISDPWAAILTVRDFVPDSEEEYLDFLKESFNKIKRTAVKNLVLDLRGNDGGDPFNANALLSYLIPGPYRYFSSQAYGYSRLKEVQTPKTDTFKGRLYILIDGFSFSTTGHLLSILKDNNVGVMIGEESGGSFLCFGCPDEFVLPNTKIILNYSRCVFAAYVNNINPGRGIFPDYQITQNISDLVKGKDTVLDFALGLIE